MREAPVQVNIMFGKNMVIDATCDLAADVEGRKALAVGGGREVCSGDLEEAAGISLVSGKPAKFDTVCLSLASLAMR